MGRKHRRAKSRFKKKPPQVHIDVSKDGADATMKITEARLNDGVPVPCGATPSLITLPVVDVTCRDCGTVFAGVEGMQLCIDCHPDFQEEPHA